MYSRNVYSMAGALGLTRIYSLLNTIIFYVFQFDIFCRAKDKAK